MNLKELIAGAQKGRWVKCWNCDCGRHLYPYAESYPKHLRHFRIGKLELIKDSYWTIAHEGNYISLAFTRSLMDDRWVPSLDEKAWVWNDVNPHKIRWATPKEIATHLKWLKDMEGRS